MPLTAAIEAAQLWIEARVPQTKALHFIIGQQLAWLTLWAFGLYWSLGLVAAVAVAKETYGHFHPTTDTWSWYSLVMTCLGGAPIWVMWLLWHAAR